jgi:pyruvate formate lyase activating enzyme
MDVSRKLADWWIEKENGVQCQLCPHACFLKPGETGLCRSRMNYYGRMVVLAFGKLNAINIDPVEKKPLYHFLPGSQTMSVASNGCNLRCLNCQNSAISQTSPVNSHSFDLSPAELVKIAVDKGCKSVSYTYTEPVVFYEYMIESAKIASKAGLYNIMVSSGYINPKPLKALIPFLDAVNIDLKCLDDSIYHSLCGASLKPVLNSLMLLKKAGVWLEITNLIIPERTDDPQMIRDMCRWLKNNGFSETPLHFSRFFPAYQLRDLPPTAVEKLNEAIYIAGDEGLEHVYLGNFSGNGSESTFCINCKNLLISRRGNIVLRSHLENGRCPGCKTALCGIFQQ